MRRTNDQIPRLGGPPVVPVAAPPNEPAMPPSAPRLPGPIRFDSEQLQISLKPVVTCLAAMVRTFEEVLPPMLEEFARIAAALEEANRGAELRHRARTDRR